MNIEPMLESSPLITVVTLVFNTGKYVLKGLDSVKNQTYPKELIQHLIIDDCSTDDSVELIEKWISANNYSCTFIKQEKNQGICAGLNQALSLAKGKYFIGLPDDFWKPEKLEKEIAIFDDLSKDYAVLYTNVDFCDENDTIYQENVVHGDSTVEGDVFEHLLRTKTFIFGPAAIYRTESLRVVGGYDISLKFEDYDMLLRLAKDYKFKYVNHSFTVYRHYTSRKGLSRSVQESGIDQLEFIKTIVKFLGNGAKTDQIILSKIYKKHVYYQIKTNRNPIELDALLKEPDMRDLEIINYYKQKRIFSSFKQFIKGMKAYKGAKRISKRDYFYLLRSYFRN